MIRARPETVSHTSFRKASLASFGATLSIEKHSMSCVRYLSKTHFVLRLLLKLEPTGARAQSHLELELLKVELTGARAIETRAKLELTG